MGAAPMRTQISAVLGRKLRITLRNPVAGALLVLVPCMMGTLVGSAFQGIGAGDKMFLQQVPFFFILVSTACFQSMGLMPGLVDERMYMKYESSEALYSEAVLALANFCVDVPLALLGSCLHIMIAHIFSGYPLSLFGPIFGWTLLVFLVFDSLFACVAAFAPDAQLAQLMATPFLTIFMLFNGFVVSPVPHGDAIPDDLHAVQWFCGLARQRSCMVCMDLPHLSELLHHAGYHRAPCGPRRTCYLAARGHLWLQSWSGD